ncbi:hypothetical protein KIH74_20925 [Kineosporia sp. J2-2]|uniref:Flagellar assembly protein FliH/Type III secretion system HrpE domain-containing protein n=1 Tax=Kineosporia corallincola TaxID=2835133 RepID=A0ABS5TP97_9ACTN|nr:FliH/SctL family protein [Kineosporia corallincola]MBT0771414.1 hypothetical protein [Kineosporia corallincola]
MALRSVSSPVLSSDEARAAVRPAQLDRPLHRGTPGAQFSDPKLEQAVRAAADQARTDAQAQGYLAGWAQGRQAAAEENLAVRATQLEETQQLRAELAHRAEDLMVALREAARQVHEATLPDWNEVADALTDGALRLAKAALGREMSTVDESVEQAVRTAVRQVSASDEAVVHLNPDDAETLGQAGVEGVRIVPDPELAPGSVTVLTPTQRLRHDLPAALAAAEEVLRS